MNICHFDHEILHLVDKFVLSTTHNMYKVYPNQVLNLTLEVIFKVILIIKCYKLIFNQENIH